MKKKAGAPPRDPKSRTPPTVGAGPAIVDEVALLAGLHSLIHSARQRIAPVAFATQALLCWHLGRRLLNENLQGSRAPYGKPILVTVSQQLSWSHFHARLRIKDQLAREFYAEMCRIESRDVRTLRQKIGGMPFARTALSKRSKTIVATEIPKLRDGQMSHDLVFRQVLMRFCRACRIGSRPLVSHTTSERSARSVCAWTCLDASLARTALVT